MGFIIFKACLRTLKVAGGQTFCLLLTLLAVPVFYSLFDDIKNLPIVNKIFGRKRSTGAPPMQPIPQPVHFQTGDHA